MLRGITLVILGLLVGVIVGDIWFYPGIWIIGLLVLIILFWKWKRWWIVFFVIASLFVGFAYSVLSMQQYETLRVQLGVQVGWSGFTHTVEGTAGELVSISEYRRKYRFIVEKIDDTPSEYEILLLLPANLSVTKGDYVVAQGKFSFPEDTPEYAGEKNLWNRGLVAEFSAFYTTKTPPEKYGFFVRLQSWFDRQLSVIFPHEGHVLLSGILLGQRAEMDTDLRDKLRDSGLMHLMVVSGGNVMMLIVFLSLFLRSVPVVVRFMIVGGTIAAFVLLVGGDAPVWRAALMGVIGYGGQLVGHRFPKLFLPILVGGILAVLNPLSIVYDIGLQLSFLSVVCIIVWGKSLAHFFRFLGPFFSEAMALTIAATIGTFPISLFYFGTLSVVGPIANLLAAPAIPILMYGGILTLFSSVFSSTVAYYVGYIPWIATTYLYRIIDVFGSLSWSSSTFELGTLRPYFIVVSLGGVILLVSRFQRRDL